MYRQRMAKSESRVSQRLPLISVGSNKFANQQLAAQLWRPKIHLDLAATFKSFASELKPQFLVLVDPGQPSSEH